MKQTSSVRSAAPRGRRRVTRRPGAQTPTAAALLSLDAFSDVDPEAMQDLTAGARIQVLPKGRVLFNEGDASDAVYVVLSGALSVSVRGAVKHVVTTLQRGDLVGEIASVAGGNRSATVRAKTSSRVVRLASSSFVSMLSERPHLAERIAGEARRRLLEGGLTILLGQVFGSVDVGVREALAERVEWITLDAGEALYAHGDDADAAYVVVFGTMQMVSGDDGATGDAGPGEIIGGRALISGGARTETVHAARDSYLVRIPRAAITELEARSPRDVLAITRALVERGRSPSSRRTSERICIAVVAASSEVDLRMFTSKLTEELEPHGPVFHAWSARADSVLGRSGVAQSTRSDVGHIALTRWLQELHHSNRIVVLEGDREWTPWTERVVREADRVLVLGPGPEPGRAEARLQEMFATGARPRIAALLHTAGTAPAAQTKARLSGRNFDEHYHVRTGVPGDYQRLARIVAGRSVALALGGGGARGFAHIGVLRVLNELNVPVDLVGGASIGAIVTVLIAAEQSPDEMLRTVEKGFAKVRDYTFPAVALLKGKRVAQSIRSQFGDRGLEDLPIPAFVVTTSLTRNAAVYHRAGDLARALRASTAIPGVYPPVVIDGELHTDGGVLDNFPVEEMRRWHQDARIIAVDLTPPEGPRAKDDFGLWVSGMRAVGQSLRRTRRTRRLPGLGDTLVRVSVVASTRDRDRLVRDGAADLYLPLAMRGVSPMDFDNVRPVVDMGYQQALPQIQAWIDAGGLDARRKG